MSDTLRVQGTLERRFLERDVALSRAEVLARWRDDASFRAWFLAWLRAAPCEAFYFETPPATRATQGEPFACVLLAAPELARLRPQPRVFREHFEAEPGAGVVTFANLGGDAVLVAPTPRAPDAAYPHLAAFVRGAPEEQQHALLRAVAASVDARLSARPLWLSTAGLGVAWLHVRLDERPKYYQHAPYRTAG